MVNNSTSYVRTYLDLNKCINVAVYSLKCSCECHFNVAYGNSCYVASYTCSRAGRTSVKAIYVDLKSRTCSNAVLVQYATIYVKISRVLKPSHIIILDSLEINSCLLKYCSLTTRIIIGSPQTTKYCSIQLCLTGRSK